MAKQLKLRRGTTTQHSSFTGAEGELTIDTTKDTAVVHDGSQAGGRPLLREDLNNLATGAIATAKIADDAVTADKLANTAVSAGTYTAADITVDAQGRITSAASGSIATTEIAADAITGAKIADDAIDSEHYTDGSIDTAHLANDAVNGSKIADDAIDSEHYTDGSIDTAHIAADQITAALIADDAVGAEHIEQLDADLSFADSAKAKFGAGNDLEISHDGSNSKIHHGGTGGLKVTCDDFQVQKNDGSEWIMRGQADGAVDLYYDDSKKFETTSGGASVTGNLDVSSGIDVTGAITGTTTISDSKGNVRSIPRINKSSAHTLVAADAGKAVYISTGGVTLPASVMTEADAVTIINDSGSNQTLTQGSGLTLYNTADATSGNRTLAGRGMATVYFASATTAYISGSGLS